MTVFQTRVSGIASARSCCPSATVTRSVGPRPSARWLHQHRASDRSQPAACAALAPIRWLGATSPAPPPARSPRAARCGPGSIIDRWISWRLWIDAVADAVVPIRAVSGAVRCKGWDRVKRDNHWRDYAAFFTKDLRDRSSTRSSLFTVPPTRSVASPDASKSTDSQKVRKRRVNVVDYHCAAIWVAV